MELRHSNRTIHQASFGPHSAGVSLINSYSFNALNWHHIVISIDGPNKEAKMYVDGQLIYYDNNINSITNFNYR